MGSAGGHLASYMSTNFTAQTYAPIDLADSASARPDFAILGFPWLPATSSPSDAPPSFVFAAVDDPLVPVQHSLNYYTALKDAKVGFIELHIFPEGAHGFDVCRHLLPQYSSKSLAACSWPALAEHFLKRLYGLPARTSSLAQVPLVTNMLPFRQSVVQW